MKILILGLGNELYGDDGIGLLAVRQIAPDVKGRADIVESSLNGVALIDLLIGYGKGMIVDAIHTGQHPVGTVIELDAVELRPVSCPSPHYTGLPEMIQIARELKLEFPDRIRILAIEINSPFVFGADVDPAILSAVKEIKGMITDQLIKWEREALSAGCFLHFERSCPARENDNADSHIQ